MKLTVTNLRGDMFNYEVSDDMELENFKALCELESGINPASQEIIWNGNHLQDDKKSLHDYGLHNGEVLLLKQKTNSESSSLQTEQSRNHSQQNVPLIDFGSLRLPGAGGPALATPNHQQMMDDPNVLRELLLARPHDLSIIKERNPELAEALLNGSQEKFAEVFRRQQNQRLDVEKARLDMLKRDQFDPEVQKMIAEEIRIKNVDMNMETAMEYSPESFGQVIMLYIDCKVNDHHVKAFVDSGAQMTIMSSECAERCHIKHLIDTRWAGVAHGVGTQKILGRVHLGQIQIGNNYLPSSFSILEHQPMDMLLGLDMLRRHQCCIDLRQNKLFIGTTNTETSFLAESELPPSVRAPPSTLPSDRTSMETDDHNLARAMAQSASEAASGHPSTSTAASPTFPESSIQTLVSFGYSRQQAVDQLVLSKGDVNQALAALIAKSIPPLPPS